MKKILTTMLVLAAAVTALVVLPLAQAGTAAKNHAVNVTVRSNVVQTVGPVTIDAARVTGGLGEGAALIRAKSAGGQDLDLTFKLWYNAGVQRGAGTVTGTPATGGDVDLAGNLHYTGGTRTFHGITGHVHLTGTLDNQTGIITATVTGNARY